MRTNQESLAAKGGITQLTKRYGGKRQPHLYRRKTELRPEMAAGKTATRFYRLGNAPSPASFRIPRSHSFTSFPSPQASRVPRVPRFLRFPRVSRDPRSLRRRRGGIMEILGTPHPPHKLRINDIFINEYSLPFILINTI